MDGKRNFVISAITAAAALLLFSACGRQSGDSEANAGPVDAWAPLAQVAPTQGIWEARVNEAYEYPAGANGFYENSEPDEWAELERMIYESARWQRVHGEIDRMLDFLVPPESREGNWSFFPALLKPYFPDYFGGAMWNCHCRFPFPYERYLIVSIVEGKECEAAEFLAYIGSFEYADIRVTFSSRSFNELIYVFNQIQDAGVYPAIWGPSIISQDSVVQVALLRYSEEEKDFFREFVANSPLIEFICIYDSGWGALLHEPMTRDAWLWSGEAIGGGSVSAQIVDSYNFVFTIYIDSEVQPLYLSVAILYHNLDGKWVPFLQYPMYYDELGRGFLIDAFSRRNVSQGYNVFEFCTAHFTRQFEGCYLIYFNIVSLDLGPGGRGMVYSFHLSHIFHNPQEG